MKKDQTTKSKPSTMTSTSGGLGATKDELKTTAHEQPAGAPSGSSGTNTGTGAAAAATQ